MDKKKSYQDLIKEYAMTQKIETKGMEWYVNFFLDSLLQEQKIRKLREDIDYALDEKNEDAFKQLSSELIELVGK